MSDYDTQYLEILDITRRNEAVVETNKQVVKENAAHVERFERAVSASRGVALFMGIIVVFQAVLLVITR